MRAFTRTSNSPFLRVRLQLDGRADVALAVRGVFEQLAELVAIAFRRGDLAAGFDHEKPRLRRAELHLPRRAERDHKIISRHERQPAELRVQVALALVDEPRLVRLGVAVKIIHPAGGARDAERHVGVAQERAAGRNRVGARRHVRRGKRAVTQRAEIREFHRRRAERFGRDDGRRQEMMVEDALDPVETFQPHDLLAVQRAVRLAELRVPLVRDVT